MPKENEENIDVTTEEQEDVEPSPQEVLGDEAFEEPTEELREASPTEEPEAEPTASDTTDGDTPTEGDPQTQEPEGDKPDAPVETAPTLVKHKVNYGGQEFEIEVTPEQAAVLDAQNKSALQFPHLQEKYTNLKHRTDQVTEMAQAQRPQPSQDAQFDPKEFQHRMKPAVDAAIDRGAISSEFAETWPEMAANMAWGDLQLQAIQRTLEPLTVRYAQDAQSSAREQVRAEIHGGMAEIAAENPDLYGDLSESTAREEFFTHLCELNVDVDILRRDVKGVLSKLWGSYQGPKLIEAARLAQAQARDAQENKRVVAGGGGGGGGGRGDTATDPLADINAILGER
jgi:hypothetical protein